MPPIGTQPEGILNADQIELVKQAAIQFSFSGAISKSLCFELAEVGVDFRSILDGCMAHPNYTPTFH